MAGLWIWVGDNLPSLSEDVHTTTTTTTTNNNNNKSHAHSDK